MEDAENIYDAVLGSKPELTPWMDWCRPDFSIDVPLDWLKNQPREWEQGINFQFVIIDNKSHHFLGCCGINHINQFYLLANLGYWVRTDRQGEGIATEATKLTALFGFQQLGLRRIEIVTGEENWPSRRVAEKTGAVFEGILRKRLKLGKKNINAAMHSLILEDLL
jgi:RimJ/RimL family protein N-acetyltransferase